MMIREPSYLGDGVFIQFSDYDLLLYTDRSDTRHKIYLDPDTLLRLIEIATDAEFIGNDP